MGKRAAAACQPPGISQRPRRRKKETPGDPSPGLGSCSGTTTRISERKAPGLGSRNGTTQAAQIRGVGPLKKRPGKRKKPDNEGGLRSCTTATQAAQIRGVGPLKKRPGKRKKPDNAGGLRSCTTATSQVPLLPTRSLSWGAKRSRTALAGSRWRDWANLDEGPAGLIAERVLANDVADYIRFRAVCPAWRRCCADPRARGGVLDDPRFYPRQWIMLCNRAYEELDAADAPHPSRRQFLNTSTGQCIQVDIPELRDHGVLPATTAEGLLLLPRKTTKASDVVRLLMLNPLTRQMAELPGITHDLKKCSSAGLVDYSTVCLYFRLGRSGTLAIAKPGDDRWMLLNTGPRWLRPTICFAGRFYGATGSTVMTVDMEAAGGPRLVVAAKLAKQFRVMVDSLHLVDNAGDLILVHRMSRRIPHPGDRSNFLDKMMYMVYWVDLKAGKMRVRSNLGGRAIFMDYCCALSVSPQVFPFLSADTIYVGRSFFAAGHGNYHLRDGSTEPCSNVDRNGGFTRPWSIADCLTAYVSK